MNDRAREVLMEAALRGIPQTRGYRHHWDGRSVCALGALHASLHGWDLAAARRCYAERETQISIEFGGTFHNVECWHDRVAMAFGIDAADELAIAHANDTLGWDFIAIANKIGHDDDDAA